jgi:hypothetical protein
LGREAYSKESWSEAYESLSRADRESSLAPDDLALLATCAYMIGREAEYRELLERAHRAHLDAGEELAALRCAFWIGVTLASHGRLAVPAAGCGAPGGCSSARGAIESSVATYCCRPYSSKRRAATGRRLRPPPARLPRSGSASAIPICSPLPPMSRARS